MEQYFEGIDPLPSNRNGFELQKNGKPYVSLYHDLSLSGFRLADGNLDLYFLSAPDATSKTAKEYPYWKMRFNETILTHLESRGEGNFVDLNEIILIGADKDRINLLIVIGAMTLTISATHCSFLKDEDPDRHQYSY